MSPRIYCYDLDLEVGYNKELMLLLNQITHEKYVLCDGDTRLGHFLLNEDMSEVVIGIIVYLHPVDAYYP